jgi:hypothetical protein
MFTMIIGPIIRHLAGAAGAILASQGLIEGGQVEAVSGAVLTLAMVAWSLFDKKKNVTK